MTHVEKSKARARKGAAGSLKGRSIDERALRARRGAAERSRPIETREFTPGLWADLEKLFGKNGACAGCWCMWWRLEEGEEFQKVHGAPLKKRFKALATGGKAHGILAYVGGEPIGWCSFDRRKDFGRLDRSPSLAILPDETSADVWSVPCFFIKAGFRGKGVATALLQAAMTVMRREGAVIAEAYPTKVGGGVKPSNGMAFTGVPALFEKAGFVYAEKRAKGRSRMRRKL